MRGGPYSFVAASSELKIDAQGIFVEWMLKFLEYFSNEDDLSSTLKTWTWLILVQRTESGPVAISFNN